MEVGIVFIASMSITMSMFYKAIGLAFCLTAMLIQAVLIYEFTVVQMIACKTNVRKLLGEVFPLSYRDKVGFFLFCFFVRNLLS